MNIPKETTLQFERALLDLDKIEAQRVLNIEHADPFEIINKVVVPAMENVGDGWHKGDIALSQVYMSGRICEQLIDDLLLPVEHIRKDQPKMGIAVLNDYHFLGKRIVYSQIRSAGFKLVDYGQQTVDKLYKQIIDDNLDLILVSTLMYPSALDVQQLTQLLKNNSQVKVIVGGAPFNLDDQLWKQVGAYAMAHNGGEALKVINQIMEEK